MVVFSLCSPIAPAHADSSFFKDKIIGWVLDGMNPQPPGNPHCADDSTFLLGHVTDDAPNNWIDAPLTSLCRRYAHPTTGALPPLVYACFTTEAPDDFFSPTMGDAHPCFCDYYLCIADHQQPFEEAVDLIVKLANMLER